MYANGKGHPNDEHGWSFQGGTSRRAYVKHARTWLAGGAALLGGRGGTGPRTIGALGGLARAPGWAT